MHAARRGRWALGLTSASVAWALALVPAAFLVSVYGTGSATLRTGPGAAHVIQIQHGSASLVLSTAAAWAC